MTKRNDKNKDAEIFAKLLRDTKLPNKITIGKFILQGTKGVKDNIQYNQTDLDLLQNQHEYTFTIDLNSVDNFAVTRHRPDHFADTKANARF